MAISFDELTGIDREHYEQKMAVLHKGPCSSPKAANGGKDCPCPMLCPLHGRCCDCIEHHKQERLDAAAAGHPITDSQPMPNCLQFFNQINGIGCEPDPDAPRKFYEKLGIPLRDKG